VDSFLHISQIVVCVLIFISYAASIFIDNLKLSRIGSIVGVAFLTATFYFLNAKYLSAAFLFLNALLIFETFYYQTTLKNNADGFSFYSLMAGIAAGLIAIVLVLLPIKIGIVSYSGVLLSSNELSEFMIDEHFMLCCVIIMTAFTGFVLIRRGIK
jgi:hypothetical protein